MIVAYQRKKDDFQRLMIRIVRENVNLLRFSLMLNLYERKTMIESYLIST